MYDNEWTPSHIDFVEAITVNPDIHLLADTLTTSRLGEGGRPSTHPIVVYVIYIALAGVLGSHRKAASTIANRHCWKIVRDSVYLTAGIDLGKLPPTRNMCEYHRGKISTQVEAIADKYRELALTQAHEHGWLDPIAPRSSAKPRRPNYVAADGKVAPSPVSEKTAHKWREQGRLIHADLHTQGGEPEPIFGAKFWLAAVRADDRRNDRVILDIRQIGKTDGGEAAVATSALEAIATKTTGLHGVCYDGALRGKHLNCLMKRGLTVLSPTHGGTKPTPMRSVECRCGDTHELWTRHGEICERYILDTGKAHLEPNPIAKRYPRRNADGTFRWYIEIALSCGTIHTERIDITPTDHKRRYNRTEHLRQYVADGFDGVYRRCYGWREDAESVNDLIQQTLYKGRMIAYTAARQFLVMLGFAIGRNSLARWLRKQRA
ncbi:hypothetical protein ACFWE3_11470 [Mycobacteriaceae bacterium NPDC060252]